MSLFQGWPDVYARRWESKDGRAGYSPVCKNEWKSGVCLKPKGKCADCTHADYLCYDTDAIAAHRIRDYGMVIVDECHHVPAVSFEQRHHL